MTFPYPGYVSDQVALTGRASAAWANAVRDRAVQVFDTTGNRDAAIPSPQAGQLCAITTGSSAGLYIYFGAWIQIVGNDDDWTTYTPTLGGWTIGNGTLSGSSKNLNGKLLVVRASLVCGSTTSFSGAPTLSMPAGLTLDNAASTSGTIRMLDSSAGTVQHGYCRASASTLSFKNGDGSTNLSPTVPWTWATSDELHANIVCELA